MRSPYELVRVLPQAWLDGLDDEVRITVEAPEHE